MSAIELVACLVQIGNPTHLDTKVVSQRLWEDRRNWDLMPLPKCLHLDNSIFLLKVTVGKESHSVEGHRICKRYNEIKSDANNIQASQQKDLVLQESTDFIYPRTI